MNRQGLARERFRNGFCRCKIQKEKRMKRAIIIGASSGIGRELALLSCEEGFWILGFVGGGGA